MQPVPVTLQDTIYNTKIVYLYVDRFDYGKNQVGKEQSSGHPKSKKVYRAIYNTDTHSYRIIYDIIRDQVYSVFVEDLQSDAPEELGYVCDIKHLSVSNILDFKISEDNLDDLLNWLKTDNKDVKEVLGDVGATKKKNTSDGKSKQIQKVPNRDSNISPEFVAFVNLTLEMYKSDPLTFGTIFDLILYIGEHPGLDQGNIGMHWLRMDKDHGGGVNISAAVEKLSRYVGGDRRTNLMNEDLMGAMLNLLNERARRTLNDIK